MKKNVAVITGGNAAELDISIASAQVVYQNLDKSLYNVFIVDITNQPWIAKQDEIEYEVDLNYFSIPSLAIHFDVAFIAIHGTPAEDGKIQGYFDLLSIPYSACSVLASAVTFDKNLTKKLLQDLPLQLAESILLRDNKVDVDAFQTHFELPLFVKPNKNGSSYGVSKVKAWDELSIAVDNAFRFDNEVLIEEFIEGRELACGIAKLNNELICFPITEIISENEFFDYEAKYEGKSKEITPAEIDETIKSNCHQLTKAIYTELQLSGACRVDYFLTKNQLYLVEVNTIPGLSAASILPQQAVAHGLSLSEFFGQLIEESLNDFNNLNH